MSLTNNGLSYWQAESDNEPLLEDTIGDCLDRRADEMPMHEAVVYSCYPELGEALNIRWTYQEYRERANKIARGLLALGLNKGEHIAVWATNIPEWLLLEMAAAKAGLVLVTINPALRAQEVEYALKQGDVAALFFMAHLRDHDCLATLRTLITPGSQHGKLSNGENSHLPMLRLVSFIGAPPPNEGVQDSWRPLLFQELIAAGSSIDREALCQRQALVSPFDAVQIQYTSGTTGFPKGAVLTHYGLLNNAVSVARRMALHQGDSFCLPMPFFHTAGCVLGALGALYAGATLHPLVTFDPSKALQIISRERCTLLLAVPTMLLAILQHPDFANYDLSTLERVVSGGTPIPVYLMEQVQERTGTNVGIVFGQTEASPIITQTRLDDPFELKAATVGIPLPYTEVKIIQPGSGETVLCGERGELCCRGYLVMPGYYQMPEKTAEAIDSEGWLHTGDLATMNTLGYINIVGRRKEMIIRGGENIFPREIEEFLIRHPKVADVQIVGVPDTFFGEVALAVVRPTEGMDITEQELRDFCASQISHQKIPHYFQFVDSYPMTASGKVQKFLLRTQAIKALGLEAAENIRTA